MKQTVTTLFLLFTTTMLPGQSNDIEFYSRVDKIETLSELTRTQGKLRLLKQHADSLNYGIIQTNWTVNKWKRYATTYLLTLSIGDKIFYREFYRPYLSEDFERWDDKKLHVSTDSSILETINKFQNSNFDLFHLTHLPYRSIFGYACYVSGTMPEDGIKMLELVNRRDTTELQKWLRDLSPVKQTYSYLGLKLLQVRDSISLTDETIERMQELEKSSKLVYSCSGCTFWGYLPMKNQLTVDNVNWFIERNKRTK